MKTHFHCASLAIVQRERVYDPSRILLDSGWRSTRAVWWLAMIIRPLPEPSGKQYKPGRPTSCLTWHPVTQASNAIQGRCRASSEAGARFGFHRLGVGCAAVRYASQSFHRLYYSQRYIFKSAWVSNCRFLAMLLYQFSTPNAPNRCIQLSFPPSF
jgi:hypothetical protein